MSPNPRDIKNKVYSLLPALVNGAEAISWSRFNNFLLFNSILILAWIALYRVPEGKNPPYILLFALAVLGLIGCFFWCALGFRGRANVNRFLGIGKKIEENSTPQPFTTATELRDKQPFSWAGSLYILTLSPLFIAMLYTVLLWMSLSNLIARIISTAIAGILIIVFIFLIFGYISREKKDNNL